MYFLNGGYWDSPGGPAGMPHGCPPPSLWVGADLTGAAVFLSDGTLSLQLQFPQFGCSESFSYLRQLWIFPAESLDLPKKPPKHSKSYGRIAGLDTLKHSAYPGPSSRLSP